MYRFGKGNTCKHRSVQMTVLLPQTKFQLIMSYTHFLRKCLCSHSQAVSSARCHHQSDGYPILKLYDRSHFAAVHRWHLPMITIYLCNLLSSVIIFTSFLSIKRPTPSAKRPTLFRPDFSYGRLSLYPPAAR